MNMKKSSSKSLTFALALSLAITLLALPSCKTVDSSQLTIDNFEVQKFRSVDTVVVRDSVFVSERQRGDTVYLTRVEWRDRWRTQLVHDTIVRVDSIVQVIEHPPERYVPPFYKRCTIALWVAVILGVLYGILRMYIIKNLR